MITGLIALILFVRWAARVCKANRRSPYYFRRRLELGYGLYHAVVSLRREWVWRPQEEEA